jgi:ribosomal 30S subunit maturation factor RimM
MQDKAINIYNLQGQEIFSKIRSNEQEEVLLPAKGIYLLKVDLNCRKVLIH